LKWNHNTVVGTWEYVRKPNPAGIWIVIVHDCLGEWGFRLNRTRIGSGPVDTTARYALWFVQPSLSALHRYVDINPEKRIENKTMRNATAGEHDILR
jgi:hypothetical protein